MKTQDKIDTKKVDLSAIYSWITTRVFELMGHQDKVVIQYISDTLSQDQHPSISQMKSTLSRFISQEKANSFVNELWDVMKSAEQNTEGFPLTLVTKQIASIIEKNQLNHGRSADYGYESFDGYGLPRKYDKNPYKSTSTASDPLPRENENWRVQHNTFVERARVLKSDDICFMGDSIIKGFERFSSVWNSFFRDRNINVFGIGGDRTQHVLYRIGHGEMSNQISLIVLHCGGDSVDKESPADIANALKAIVFEIQRINAPCSILVIGLIPRDMNWILKQSRIAMCNQSLKEAFDNKKIFNVWYLDPGEGWTLPDGKLDPKLYHTDFYHLSEAGYKKMSKQLCDKLDNIFNEKLCLPYKKLLNQELIRIEDDKSASSRLS